MWTFLLNPTQPICRDKNCSRKCTVWITLKIHPSHIMKTKCMKRTHSNWTTVYIITKIVFRTIKGIFREFRIFYWDKLVAFNSVARHLLGREKFLNSQVFNKWVQTTLLYCLMHRGLHKVGKSTSWFEQMLYKVP